MVKKRFFKFLFAFLLAFIMFKVCAAVQEPDDIEPNHAIEIGIAPYLPIKTLIQNYAPLRDFLQKQLHEPVTIVSAPDYQTYYERIDNHEYPVIITTAHSALLAWTDSGYIPLLQPLNYTSPAIVTAKGKSLRYPDDLRGKKIAMSDALAIISMQGIQLLREDGLDPMKEISILNLSNHRVAINYVITGEADAAIVSDRAIMQMPQSVRDQIDIVFIWEKSSAPGIVYLGSPLVPQELLERITRAILEFSENTSEGKLFMTQFGYGGLKPVTANELKWLAPYGALLKEALSNAP